MNLLLLFAIFSESLRFRACDQSTGKAEGKISLSIPQLSEEETGSNHMPLHLKCDACIAITYQMKRAFNRALSKMNTLKESDVIDILEDTCNRGFADYGVKQVDGANRISGPGLVTEHVMGMTQMGGRWPHRLQEMCHYYIGEIGELEIYEAFSGKTHTLTEFMCYGKGVNGQCRHLKNAPKEEL